MSSRPVADPSPRHPGHVPDAGPDCPKIALPFKAVTSTMRDQHADVSKRDAPGFDTLVIGKFRMLLSNAPFTFRHDRLDDYSDDNIADELSRSVHVSAGASAGRFRPICSVS